MHDAATGANKTDYHVIGLEPGRDFDLTDVADIRNAVEGDRCPRCGEPFTFKKCIEIGHVFDLGTRYSAAMKASVLDADGKARPLLMGCYGMGLNRVLAAVVENSHDEAGIIWPMSIAPYQVLVVALDLRDDQVRSVADDVHDQLEANGIQVLMDDRDARPGVKFNDADLIGIPLRVTIGKRSLSEGVVEVKRRDADEIHKTATEAAAETIGKLIAQALPA
jgi:prolyl-tRNA synthetase